MKNSFGNIFRITSFGESHGTGVGVVIDGCPANISLDFAQIQSDLDRRKPGQSALTTARKEADEFELVSGVFEGRTTGSPIAILIKNLDARSKDYGHIATQYRPSHADYTYEEKYGHRDYRGGGRSSARITAGWVAAGAIAKQVIAQLGIRTRAYVSQVGDIRTTNVYSVEELLEQAENDLRCPDSGTSEAMVDLIKKVKKSGDTIGGVVTGVVSGVPVGLGEPIFMKLHAQLGMAMLSINAVKGFDYGSGFDGVSLKGSEHNDTIEKTDSGVRTQTNYSGGVQGGISNGEEIYFRVAFKPVATIMQPQDSINKEGDAVKVEGKGRHDPCVVPRAVPIVEAMTALVMADFVLMNQTTKLGG